MRIDDYPDTLPELGIPFMGVATAGFPSPAEEYLEQRLDLLQELIRTPSATFFMRVEGRSMENDGIHHGDIVVIDRSIKPEDGRTAVCFVDGGITLKKLRVKNGRVWLMPANADFKPLEVQPEDELSVWGVVTYTIHRR
jgi:DNA polymerase V